MIYFLSLAVDSSLASLVRYLKNGSNTPGGTSTCAGLECSSGHVGPVDICLPQIPRMELCIHHLRYTIGKATMISNTDQIG